MRGLVPYALRSLRARPARTALTLAGIALGVAVLLAGLATNAGIDGSIGRTVNAIVGLADVRVAAFSEQGLSAASVAAIADVPGVAVAAPAIERRTYLEVGLGAPELPPPVTVLGVDPDAEQRVRDLALVRGSPLRGIDEPAALITERLAREDGLDVGADLSLLGAGAPVRVRVVGILQGDGPVVGAVGRAVIVPLGTAARLTVPDPVEGETPPPSDGSALPDGIARVDVQLAAGADATAVIAAIEQALVFEPYVLTRPADVAASLRASTGDFRATTSLLAAVALFAGAFLIANTLAMTVVERIRELGLLRAAGATRRQITRVVAVQALVLGATGSLLGLALGSLLAIAITSSLRSVGNVTLEAPDLSPVVLVVAFVVGCAVTLAAAVEPARRAASVSPVEALRARGMGAGGLRTRVGWLIVVLGLVAVSGSIALPAGSGPAGAFRALVVYALLLVAVLAAPVLIGPLGRLVGLPFSAVFRFEERLARAAIVRDRGRTTLTVGALVVGLAMIVALGSVATNARGAATAWLEDVVPGDEVVTAIAPVPLDDLSPVPELEAIAGVVSVAPIATFDLAVAGQRVGAAAFDGVDLAEDGRLRFVAGDRIAALEALDAGGAAILPSSVAERLGVGVDDVLVVPDVTGAPGELRVAGIVERSLPSGTGDGVLVGWGDALGRFGVQGADAFAVRYEPGAPPAAHEAVAALAFERALTVAPLAEVETAVTSALDRVFGLFDLLALAAVIVAALGIVNTLSMDVWERVRELGVLRAAGMSRRQVWRTVIVEAGLLGAIAVVVGVGAGLLTGAVLVVTAGGRLEGVPLDIPWSAIAVAAVLGIVLAMLAAAWPARLASRLEIVRAVRAE